MTDRDYAELLKRCKALNDYNGYISQEIAQEAFDCVKDAADAIQKLLVEVKHWELEAAANETDRQYLIDENRKLVDSLMPLLMPHGDLIDRSKITFVYSKGEHRGLDYARRCVIDGMPVIVPANS